MTTTPTEHKLKQGGKAAAQLLHHMEWKVSPDET
jgi:hypothetical protein